ncbi:MAG: DUF1566 domain-containing protein [Rhodospirillales bacterium]|nr:DUF1566 domain-containing protein [Rhodospirillales bacterium]
MTVILFLLLPSTAHAACSSPAGVEGEITYLTDESMMQYCDGTNWIAMGRKGNDPAASCSTIGDTCPDGSVYAGLTPDGNVPMYTTPADAPSLMTWNDGSSNWVDTAMVNCTDATPGTAASCQTGAANTALLVALNGSGTPAPYAAAEYCAGLSAYGHADWYLPAQDELDVLYDAKNAGDLNGTFNETGSLPAGWYWSSSENANGYARLQRFSDGSQSNGILSKDYGLAVRCVRKGSPGGNLSSGLVGYWKLDETSGTIAADSSGNGNNGTMAGGLDATNDSVTGKIGTALDFDGTDDYIDTNNNSSLDDLSNLTYAAWIKGSGAILTKKSNPGGNESFQSWPTGITFVVANSFGSSAGTAKSIDVASADTWNHVVGTYDRSGDKKLRIYLNGTEVNYSEQDTLTFSLDLDFNFDFQIGWNEFSGGSNFTGSIDDVRIYNRALSSSEIGQLYCQGVPGKIEYDADDHVMQFCSDQGLHPMGKPGSDPAASCSNIGDLCPDGSVYAGLTPDGNVPMYVPRCDIGMSWDGTSCSGARSFLPWNNGNAANYVTTSQTSTITGRLNTSNIITLDSDSGVAGTQPHQAAQSCEDLNVNGHMDWYLPAKDELNVLYTNRAAIGELSTGGDSYWSSTEVNNGFSLRQRFSDGAQLTPWKSNVNAIRCVRTGSPGGCTNPTAPEGEMTYNQTFNTMQYCNGTQWIAIGK